MGGRTKSSSKSSSTTITTTNQTDNRIGVSDNGMVATGNARISNYNYDVSQDVIAEALKQGFGFGEEALEATEATAKYAIQRNQMVSEAALDFGEDIAGDAFDLVKYSTRDAFDFGEDSLEAVERIAKDSLSRNQLTTKAALDFGEDVTGEAFDFGQSSLNLVSKAMDAVEDTNAAEITQLAGLAQSSIENVNAAKANFDSLMKAGTVVAGVFLLSRVIK